MALRRAIAFRQIRFPDFNGERAAEEMGTSSANVSRWSRDATVPHGEHTIRAVARFIDVPPEEMGPQPSPRRGGQ